VEYSALYGPALAFLRRNIGKDVLVVAMERQAADHIVRELVGSHAGIHRYSLRQLIAALAAPVLTVREQRPITSLAAAALAAQVIAKTDASYYRPVANTPGFPAALVETLTGLRLEKEVPPSPDLLALAQAYSTALGENNFADAADQCEAAIALTVSRDAHPLLGLPTLLIDIRSENACEERFLELLAARAEGIETIFAETRPTERIPQPACCLARQTDRAHRAGSGKTKNCDPVRKTPLGRIHLASESPHTAK